MNCSFRICFLIAVSGWISWNLLYLYIFSFISSFFEACNNFLIRTTLLISASSVSVKHHVVYRTLQLAVSPRSAHSSNLCRKRVRQEWALLSSALLPALLLGKELSERRTVIARNLLPFLTHSWNSFFEREKKLRESYNAKDTLTRKMKDFFR